VPTGPPSPSNAGSAAAPPPAPPGPGSSKAAAGSPPPPAPGLRDSIGTVRGAATTLVKAHVELLKAELGEILKQVAIIAALAGIALVLAILAGILVWVGSWLFVGEWLFGSMGWGIVHGVLFTICVILPIALNLAGGDVRAWVRALIVSLIIGVLVGVVLSTNALHNAADWLEKQDEGTFAVQRDWLIWLVPAIAIGLLFGLIGTVTLRRGGVRLMLVGLIFGFIFGFALAGFYAATPFNTQVAAAFAVTAWLISWIALTAWFAVRAGINPQKRYERLAPHETMAQVEATKAYVEQQWQRQRKNLVGR